MTQVFLENIYILEIRVKGYQPVFKF